MGVMKIMGMKGDEKLVWDSDDDIQTKRARDKFLELVKKGYHAFISKDVGGTKKGERIDEFDPNAERLIMVPPMQGG